MSQRHEEMHLAERKYTHIDARPCVQFPKVETLVRRQRSVVVASIIRWVNTACVKSLVAGVWPSYCHGKELQCDMA